MTSLMPFAYVLIGMLVVMTGAWITQRTVKNAGWVDVFWTLGSGASCVFVALWPSTNALMQRQLLVAALAAIWALRLALYVAFRVARSKAEDARYAGLRKDWGADFQSRMFALVIIQAPATTLLTLSVFAAAHGGAASLGLRDMLGALVLVIAIGGEGLADEQMRRFKQTPGHGRIMDRGLWGWSRHPNYFFEWIGWLAYPIIALDIAAPATWITLLAPVIMYLILRYGTGVPALEKIMLESRGDEFRAYQTRVGAFIPYPPRRNAS
jgi:steroid 5-alpha reductase family enzyme